MKTKKKIHKTLRDKKRVSEPKQELHDTALLRPYPPKDNVLLEKFYDEWAETASKIEPITTVMTERRR